MHAHDEPCCYDSGAWSIGPESDHHTKFARLSGIDAILNRKHRKAIDEPGIIGDSPFVGHERQVAFVASIGEKIASALRIYGFVSGFSK
jgi:hypothetical protein